MRLPLITALAAGAALLPAAGAHAGTLVSQSSAIFQATFTGEYSTQQHEDTTSPDACNGERDSRATSTTVKLRYSGRMRITRDRKISRGRTYYLDVGFGPAHTPRSLRALNFPTNVTFDDTEQYSGLQRYNCPESAGDPPAGWRQDLRSGSEPYNKQDSCHLKSDLTFGFEANHVGVLPYTSSRRCEDYALGDVRPYETKNLDLRAKLSDRRLFARRSLEIGAHDSSTKTHTRQPSQGNPSTTVTVDTVSGDWKLTLRRIGGVHTRNTRF